MHSSTHADRTDGGIESARQDDLDEELDEGVDTEQPPVDEYDEDVDAPESELDEDDLEPDDEEEDDLE